jgi:hypothetical protein
MVSLNTMVLDVLDNMSITLHIVNIYHTQPARGHDLHHILHHEPDDTIPTTIVGDLNTHSPMWSLPGHTPSSWATLFIDWMGANSFQCKNPPEVPMWVGSRETDHPSILDLILANDLACYSAQLGDVTVSLANSLGSDHATLIFDIFPLDSIAIIPPPTPSRFKVNDELKDSWVKEFIMLLPPGLPYTSHHTLKPNRIPDPRGARWWDNACSVAYMLARTTLAGQEQHKAARYLCNTVANAKRVWAHDQSNEVADT